MGTTYNVIHAVDLDFQPDDSLADRIKAELGEGVALACHLGYTPDVTLTRDVSAEVKLGLHTYVLMSNESTVVANFGVVITDALRKDDTHELLYSADAPEDAMNRLSQLVGAPLRQVSCQGLIILEGEALLDEP